MARSASFLKVILVVLVFLMSLKFSASFAFSVFLAFSVLNKFFNSFSKSRFFQGRLPNFTAILFSISPGTATIICSIFPEYLTEKGTRADFKTPKNSDFFSGVLNLNLRKMWPRLLKAAMRVLVPPMSMTRYII